MPDSHQRARRLPEPESYADADDLHAILPIELLEDILDTGTIAIVETTPNDTDGWSQERCHNDTLKACRSNGAVLGWRRAKVENFEVARHDETNTEFKLYRGGAAVGSQKPDFYSKRFRMKSEEAGTQATFFDLRDEHGERLLDDPFSIATDAGVAPSRPGVRYLLVLLWVSEFEDGAWHRRAQVVVNPAHDRRRVNDYERILSVDLPPWTRDVTNSAPDVDDGGTGAELDVTRGATVDAGGHAGTA